jgi:CRISPR-associated endonuclease/helicase Cas3
MWAHSSNHLGRRHGLVDHLRSVSALAGRFGVAFGAAELCALLGLLHDAGKADPAWQQRLLEVDGSRERVGVPHKELGGRLVTAMAGAPGALCVLGHHGGLSDLEVARSIVPGDRDGSTCEALIEQVPEIGALLADPPWVLPPAWDTMLVLEMGLRLAFSALVDADHLDTAAHFAGDRVPAVRPPADMRALLSRFESARAGLLAGRPASRLDAARQEVYEDVVRAAAGPTGIYRLPAPTGAGKTMAAAAFALHHAVRTGKSRVIVAVPYITITEQNAQVYRQLLGDEVVLEHHSAVDLERAGVRARLGAENWDAPFVVTTTVQLFDSLFGRKPGRSRKVHRLANAVVVLDEVQSLPAELLLPILDGLRTLSERFGATVLLASATQPSFHRLAPWRPIEGRIRDTVEDAVGTRERFRRVGYEWLVDDGDLDLAAVARRIAEQDQALAVVNTVGHARRLFRLVRELCPDAALHLSTRMCPAHRRDTLERVSARLAAGEPCLLVSTQLIEAGVDLDFPVVFRALAPAESVLQAAGRCNREHRLVAGRVVVFQAADAPVPAFYRSAVGATRRFFGPDKAELDDADALDRYYRFRYRGSNLDQAGRGKDIQGCRQRLDYLAVADGPLRDAGLLGLSGGGRDPAKAFRMLDDDSAPVAVTGYGDAGRVLGWLDRARDPQLPLGPTLRALQPYVVALPRRIAAAPDVQALLLPVVGDLLQWQGPYDQFIGIDDADTITETVW